MLLIPADRCKSLLIDSKSFRVASRCFSLLPAAFPLRLGWKTANLSIESAIDLTIESANQLAIDFTVELSIELTNELTNEIYDRINIKILKNIENKRHFLQKIADPDSARIA